MPDQGSNSGVELGPTFGEFVGDNKWFIPTVVGVLVVFIAAGVALRIWMVRRVVNFKSKAHARLRSCPCRRAPLRVRLLSP
eukprot:311370-Rhodomonas_salina.1